MAKKSRAKRSAVVDLPDNMLPQNIIAVGDQVEENKNIYISQSVYKEIHKFTKNKTTNESGGMLVGSVIDEFGKTNIVISGFVEAKFCEATPTTLKFTHETWEYVHGEIAEKFEDGKIVVNADKTEKVKLVLDNVDVACSEGAPLVVESADKTVLTLAEGSVNTFTDATASAGDASVNACICSKDDLAINGTGTLIVNGNVNNGIGSKNDLEIISGTIQVQAVKNGLKGNDSVSVLTGTIGITCGKDGIKSDNDTETGKGFVYIENAAVTVNAGDDGIQAVNAIVYKSGSYEVTCTGKKTNCDVLEDISETVKVTEK